MSKETLTKSIREIPDFPIPGILFYRNTGHFWYLHNPEYPEKGTIILFHKHKADDKYHLHSRGNSLGQVVRSIKSHDRFQLNGRKLVRR